MERKTPITVLNSGGILEALIYLKVDKLSANKEAIERALKLVTKREID